MTTTETQSLIGKPAKWPVGGGVVVDVVDVVDVDVRVSFGRTDLRIKPASGTGEKWVSSESVNLVTH